MTWVLRAVVVAAVFGAAPARAQELLFRGPQVLEPGAGGVPLLLDADGVPVGAVNAAVGPSRSRSVRDPAEASRLGGVRGTVGGFGQDNQANASVGFTYVVPFWSFQAFQVPVPNRYEGLFPTFGRTGPVDSRFAYAPRVNLDYYVADMDASVGASGTFLNLSGRVDRQASGTNTPSGLLTANATLTLVSANVVEFGRRFAFFDLFPDANPHKPGMVDSVIELRIGTRFVSVEQNYTGTLIGGGLGALGTNVSTRFSSQSFRGIGLTGAVTWEVPHGENWVFFSTTRLSALVGENRRNSTISVTVAPQTGGPNLPSFSDAQFDSRTILVPVTEMEIGADWGLDLAARLREGLEPPRFVVRVAAVGQYWGGLGPLSAGSTQKFRDSDLFLIGGHVQAGFRY
ncbi:MAG TPA: hypothetical protein VD866_08625 [Urbifossiella sp.]|nr:hypothetical protein [Urbifossiella sp.]